VSVLAKQSGPSLYGDFVKQVSPQFNAIIFRLLATVTDQPGVLMSTVRRRIAAAAIRQRKTVMSANDASCHQLALRRSAWPIRSRSSTLLPLSGKR
jgi:hypothetical protein